MNDLNAQPATEQSLDRRALLHDALEAIEALEARLQASDEARSEPIAIVGMGCRFPGGVDSPESYWQLLHDGRDAVTHFPAERIRIARAFGVDPVHPDGTPFWQGGFVDGIDQFDPQFFGISPREAITMDPQQRMVLEVAWEALERAGQAPDQLNGSATGVFLGISTSDYGQVARVGGFETLDAYAATGGSMNVAAGRLAFTLGLQGPCLAVDTACSSSLVAVHLAVRSLRAGECSMALAGGVNLTLLPDGFVIFNKWGMTAPNGRCKSFDASADGFVRAEGCGMLVCKRLRDAVADGDNILALIRGSAVNQDGRSSGLTVPSGLAQQSMLRAALRDAGVEPAEVQYIEAHGTGTSIGDPIEVEAIGAVLGDGRTNDQPLFLSSAKTNIGHLESASGVAGLIKVILSMQHEEIAPLLHLRERNPNIPWPAFPVEIPTTPTPWPARYGRRIAGVSGFGFSGTNAHVVLESAPARAVAPAAERDTARATYGLLPLSAKSPAALEELIARFAHFLAEHPATELADLCNTAATGRAHFPHRAAFVASTTAQMAQKLAAPLSGNRADAPPPSVGAAPRVAFLFTGQGSQYGGMGATLYKTAPVFRAALDRCAAILAHILDRPLLEILFATHDDTINQTAYTQPALFALEYALSELWRSWGVTPVAVLGHSVGEYVAAVVAGVLSLEDGLTLIAERGRLMQSLPAGGAMAAIFASETQVRDAVMGNDVLSIAAINGPAHTVISGAADAVARVADSFNSAGVRVQQLTVSHAFHSPLMESILDPFARAAAAVTLRPPRIPLISNATGQVASADIATPAYWRKHVRDTVHFSAGVETLERLGVDVLVEIGPQPVLLGMARAIHHTAGAPAALPSLRKGHDDWEQMLSSLGTLYVRGASVRWPTLAEQAPWRKLALPTYPYQRRRFWVDLPAASVPGQRVTEGHPLLGRRTRSPLLRETIYTAYIGADQPPYLADHRIQGQIVFPGSAYVEMALAAAAGFGAHDVAADLSFRAMLTLPADILHNVQLLLTPESDAKAGLKVVSSLALEQDSAGWADTAAEYTLHAEGGLRRNTQPVPADLDLPTMQARLAAGAVATDSYYADMAEHGLDYGPVFRGLAQLYAGDGEALGKVELSEPEQTRAGAYQFHPALLDACFHVIGAAMRPPDESVAVRQFYVPIEIEGMRIYQPGRAHVWCHAQIVAADAEGAAANAQGNAEILSAALYIVDEGGSPVASIDRIHLRLVKQDDAATRAHARAAKWLYEVLWQPQLLADAASARDEVRMGRVLVFAEDAGLGASVALQLEASGATCVRVASGAATRRIAPNCWQLDPTDATAFAGLLQDESSTTPFDAVAFLWPLDETGDLSHPDTQRARRARSGAGALHLVQALAAQQASGGDLRNAPPRLFLATRAAQPVGGAAADPVAATLWGFGRSAANELPGLRCTLIDIDATHTPHSDEVAGLAAEILADNFETQIALRGQQRFVARLQHLHAPAHPGARPLRLTVPARGKLEALTWEPLERTPPLAGEVEVAVRVTGLNFRDVLNVLGMYPGDPGAPGLECAGYVAAVGEGVTHVGVGDRVLVLTSGAFDGYVHAAAALTFPLPDNLTFAEAVSLPSAYLTAAYGLINLAQVQPGERVLIHAAAGGVGIAAVRIAQRVGAEVFATAGSAEKHAFLRALGVRHIYSSRTLDFADQILADTAGAGVDVVLNSLADAFIDRSVEVLAARGRFLEIGKRGIWSPEQFVAARPHGAYYAYDLTAVLQDEPALIDGLLKKIVCDASSGSLEPLPLRAFPAAMIVDAFRFMAQARHIGKIVITHPPSEAEGMVRADSNYLITGGLGGLGLAVAQGLAAQGARHLTLVGRSAATPAAAVVIEALRGEGIQVQVLAADVSLRGDVERVLAAAAAEQPPLRGIVHAAGVLEDGIVMQQRWERFERVFAPKVDGALHLDALSRTLPIDFFVLFSSAAALLGSPGQSNYAAANAALDALAHRRRAAGLPALSINWGAWSEVGMAARLGAQDQQRAASKGIGMLSTRDGVAAFDLLLAQDATQAAVLPIDWAALRSQMGADAPPPFYAAMFKESDAVPSQQTARLEEVRMATSGAARRAALEPYVAEQVVRVLGIDASYAPDPMQALIEVGMDSLMAVELRNRLETDLRVSLALASLFDRATIHSLADAIDAQLDAARPPDAANASVYQSRSPADLLSHLDELSDADVDALLTAMLTEKRETDES